MSAVIVVHGGAWSIPEHLAEGSLDGVKAAARAGSAVLRGGGSALDAVEAAVRALEDNSVFNAGSFIVINACIKYYIFAQTEKPNRTSLRTALCSVSVSPSAGGRAQLLR